MRWKKDHIRLFISHISSQKAFAHDVSDALAKYGIDGFVAHDDIPETAPWQLEILEALETCDALALLLHDGFIESKWCDQEVGIAFEKGKILVPVCLERNEEGGLADPHGFAGNFQKVNCVDLDSQQTAKKVYRALANDEGDIGEKLKMALVRALHDSNDHAEAGDRAQRIRRYIHEAHWQDPALVRALLQTLRNNHVSTSKVARGIVDDILGKNPLPELPASGVSVFDPTITVARPSPYQEADQEPDIPGLERLEEYLREEETDED